MRVRPGDNAVLYCDCVWKAGSNIVWFRVGPLKNLMISYTDLLGGDFLEHAFIWNYSNQTYDLLVKNVSESELGLYYCANREGKLDKGGTGDEVQRIYQYGNRTTRLSLLDSNPSTPPVSDCSVCWKLLVCVCPVLVLLSSTCVYCIYRNTTKGEKKEKEKENKNEDQMKSIPAEGGGAEGGDDEVVYTPVNITSRGQNRLNRVELSDICTYSEVIVDQTISGAEVEMKLQLAQDQHARLYDVFQRPLPRYSLEWNSSSSTHDLQVKNVSESDLGLYYCALREKITEGKAGGGVQKDVYRYGNRTTRLSLL
ncbi:hypothetical protein NFI96_022157, partial [Prochilodus magdalenae]